MEGFAHFVEALSKDLHTVQKPQLNGAIGTAGTRGRSTPFIRKDRLGYFPKAVLSSMHSTPRAEIDRDQNPFSFGSGSRSWSLLGWAIGEVPNLPLR